MTKHAVMPKTLTFVISFLAMAIGQPLVSHGALAQTKAETPDSCAKAQLFQSVGKFQLAFDFADMCAREGKASRELTILTTYIKANALLGLKNAKDALAAFESLLSPQYETSAIFSRKEDGINALGATRGVIFAQSARLALGLGDAPKAYGYAQKALIEAAREPSLHIDVAGEAYMLRARIRADRNEGPLATKDMFRAYNRGNQDPWVIENLKQLPPADMAKLDAIKTRMVSAYREYQTYYSMKFISGPKTMAELKAKGDVIYQAVIADETALIGPDK